MNVDFSILHALLRMAPRVLVMAGSVLPMNRIDRTALGFGIGSCSVIQAGLELRSLLPQPLSMQITGVVSLSHFYTLIM